ncbi:Global transcription regulator sge1 [Cyberlindnera fabianii]|uniref:Global transcription regulator sge1 n=1 Tax=Cyberlindnera fabianii TaxID=36022 RepID=A0A1V2KZY2_CYBFA|nr:Global transcription regulator sge1 [Cyberlindnera fabianii]
MAHKTHSPMMAPTFVGYIGSTKDALIVIQAVLSGQLHATTRRPHDRERPDLIKSGNVFVFIEERSAIRRWTDGVAWSPSRILGRFLVYRELDRSTLTSKDARGKGATDKHRKKKSIDLNEISAGPAAPPPTQTLVGGSASSVSSGGSIGSLGGFPSVSHTTSHNSDLDSVNDPSGSSTRQLVGSLVASYAFKDSGLIKKTLSLTVRRLDPETHQPVVETIHLVSYYAPEDVMNHKLSRPVESPTLKDIPLTADLWNAVKETSLGGKVPTEDEAMFFMENPSLANGLGINMGGHTNSNNDNMIVPATGQIQMFANDMSIPMYGQARWPPPSQSFVPRNSSVGGQPFYIATNHNHNQTNGTLQQSSTSTGNNNGGNSRIPSPAESPTRLKTDIHVPNYNINTYPGTNSSGQYPRAASSMDSTAAFQTQMPLLNAQLSPPPTTTQMMTGHIGTTGKWMGYDDSGNGTDGSGLGPSAMMPVQHHQGTGHSAAQSNAGATHAGGYVNATGFQTYGRH